MTTVKVPTGRDSSVFLDSKGDVVTITDAMGVEFVVDPDAPVENP